MAVTTSTFNERFTELANEMEETSQYKKLGAIETATGISAKTLRKYYISPKDDELKNPDNRIKMPKIEVIAKLAAYFQVSMQYLSGESDVRNADVNAILKSKQEKGLTETIIESIEDISNLKDSSTYMAGLEYLLDDIQGSKDDTRQPYHLLYLIGKYFTFVRGIQQSVVSPADIEEIRTILSRQSITQATMKDVLKRVSSTSMTQETDPSLHYLAEITEELKTVRAYIDRTQKAVFEVLMEEYKKLNGEEDLDIELSE